MSCSSIRHRFDELMRQGGVNFEEANHLYNDLRGSLEAHRIEYEELLHSGDQGRIEELRRHIATGEEMLNQLRSIVIR